MKQLVSQYLIAISAACCTVLVLACLPAATESGAPAESSSAGTAMAAGNSAGGVSVGGSSSVGGGASMDGSVITGGSFSLGAAGAAPAMADGDSTSPTPDATRVVLLDGVSIELGPSFVVTEPTLDMSFLTVVHEPSGAFALLEVADGGEAELVELMSAPYPLAEGGGAALVSGPSQQDGYYVSTFSSTVSGDIVVYGRAEGGRVLLLSGQNVGSMAADLAVAMTTAVFPDA